MNLFPVKRHEKIVMQIILVLAAVIWMFPIFSAIERSFYSNGIYNYVHVFTRKIGDVTIYQTFSNSFLIAIVKTAFLVTLSSTAAYAFSKMKFRGKEIIYLSLVACLAVPIAALIVPFFYTLTRTGLYNTYWAVILTEVALEVPFAVLMLRNFYDGLPNELMESAYIDGANQWQIYTKVYAPLAYPALINLAILGFMWSFKDFIIPSTFATDERLTTATVAISRFNNSLGATPDEMGVYNASLVILGLPTVIIFSFSQKFIRKGLVSGAVKS